MSRPADLEYFVSVGDVVVVDMYVQRLFVVKTVVIVLCIRVYDTLLGVHANVVYLRNTVYSCPRLERRPATVMHGTRVVRPSVCHMRIYPK